MNNSAFSLNQDHKNRQAKRIRQARINMANKTPANVLQTSAEYHDKAFRTSITFRPQDVKLYKRLKDEKGNMSPLVRELLKKHFDKIDSQISTD